MAVEANKVKTSFPYWLSIAVGLDGVAGNRKTGNTLEADADLFLRGGTTNLSTSKAKIGDFSQTSLGSSGPLQMGADTPLLAMFGKRDSARPVLPWGGNFTLLKGGKIRSDVLNVGGESRGHLVFVAEPTQSDRPAVVVPDNKPMGYFSVNAGFTGVASEPKSTTTNPLSFDVLILGAYTDLVQASTSIRIIDHTGQAWCNPNSYVPLWAVAGRVASQLPVVRWQAAYYLPAREVMQIGFQNAVAADTPESNGSVTFEYVRLS